MHIASRVVGTLAPGRHAVDALAATFPAGTLTGAPKIRAMEIIEDLEPVRRGAYGGAVGYLDFAGNLDVAIAIRTAVVANGTLHVQAGAGIVADSVPESEALECENKARALMRAVDAGGGVPVILVVDNYDSFTFNLVQILATLDPDVVVVRNDALTVDEILASEPDRIVVSPGPGPARRTRACPARSSRGTRTSRSSASASGTRRSAPSSAAASRGRRPSCTGRRPRSRTTDAGSSRGSRTRSRRRATTRSPWRRIPSRTRCG